VVPGTGMILRRVRAVSAVALVLWGCGSGADELLDTAKLEELQNNRPHARELYREVMRKYPETPQARVAEERLRALEAGG
jgi:TolA-binding protein